MTPQETRRTGPTLRDLCRDALSKLETEVVGPDNPLIRDMRVYLDEMSRRSPKYKVARKRDADPTPEQIIRIRRMKAATPSMSYKEIALAVDDTSVRCVSYALVGRRDGSAVFDDEGVRITKPLALGGPT